MQAHKNDRFLRAIAKQPVDATPVWLMRQAGRYLPEYRATRVQAGSFLKLCQTPELACEVTLQPLRRYPLDAAIIFSDILTIPDAMGLNLTFVEGEGPVFKNPIQAIKQIENLQLPQLEDLQYVYAAIKLVKQELNGRIPLIGFCGSPWTLAAYMIEGQGKTGFPQAFKMLETNPQALHQLLEILATAVAMHLQGQIAAGAEAVMLFDTWGGLLQQADYLSFSLSYMQAIIKKLHSQNIKTPIIVFTKGGGKWLTEIAAIGCDVISLDWQISLNEARKTVGDRVTLQGNLNPGYLHSAENTLRAEIQKVLAAFGKGPGHIFNLGHGITPDVKPEQIGILVDSVHEMSGIYHQGV